MIKGSLLTNYFALLIRFIITLIVLSFGLRLNAQLCNGSLGDPVVDITFGSGYGNTNYVPSNSYIYVGNDCPNDGSYTITTSTSNCFGNTWHTVTADHTGNGGAFMLVNASYEPSDFFVTTVTNLCPSTTYQFSAWIMNVLNTHGIRPNLTFHIESANGDTLGKYSTGDIPETSSPEWKEYGLYFTTPSNNAQITLRITNNAPGGNGNDLALDDITFRPCGASIKAFIQGHSDTVDVCDGDLTDYNFMASVSAGYNNPVYQWQLSTDKGTTWQDISGATSLSYLRKSSSTGLYWYRLAVAEQSQFSISGCRIASNVVVINVHQKPNVDAGPDRILIGSTPITILATITGDPSTYFWNPGSYLNNDTLLQPTASPPADMKYTISATSKYGCKNNDFMNIKVVSGIFIPNAFTPNGDGKNDHWHIPFLDKTLNATVNVYNRYGQIVYHAKGSTVDWDGTFNGLPQPSGAYVYYIRFNGAFPDAKGILLLIR